MYLIKVFYYTIDFTFEIISFFHEFGVFFTTTLPRSFHIFFITYISTESSYNNIALVFSNFCNILITLEFIRATFDDLFMFYVSTYILYWVVPSTDTLSYLYVTLHINLFDRVVFLIVWSFSIIFFIYLNVYTLLSLILSSKVFNFLYQYFQISNEVENSIANFKDILIFSVFSLCMLYFVIDTVFFVNATFSNVECLILVLILNLITIWCYIIVFNIHIYTFIKGLYGSIKLIVLSLDMTHVIIFLSRLMLQYVRLLICSAIFWVFQELFDMFYHSVYYMQSNITMLVSFDNKTMFSLVSSLFRAILEFLDITINFLTQFSTYIIFIMWLIPYLFTFIKKKLKI